MSRERDENKRRAILAEAKRLFAESGFDSTSVPDIVRGIGLPVGTIYTYFEGKDDIARAVVEEGWSAFFDEMKAACEDEPRALARLYLVVERFLPSLFEDVDLISILLSEGLRFTHIGEKLSSVSDFIGTIVTAAATEQRLDIKMSREQIEVALSIYFLGSLDTIRLTKTAGRRMSGIDVITFIRQSIANVFGMAEL